jgi:hypothetical protein
MNVFLISYLQAIFFIDNHSPQTQTRIKVAKNTVFGLVTAVANITQKATKFDMKNKQTDHFMCVR